MPRCPWVARECAGTKSSLLVHHIMHIRRWRQRRAACNHSADRPGSPTTRLALGLLLLCATRTQSILASTPTAFVSTRYIVAWFPVASRIILRADMGSRSTFFKQRDWLSLSFLFSWKRTWGIVFGAHRLQKHLLHAGIENTFCSKYDQKCAILGEYYARAFYLHCFKVTSGVQCPHALLNNEMPKFLNETSLAIVCASKLVYRFDTYLEQRVSRGK